MIVTVGPSGLVSQTKIAYSDLKRPTAALLSNNKKQTNSIMVTCSCIHCK